MRLHSALVGVTLLLASPVNAANLTGATANLAPNDPAGQWTRQARDYANTRYSPLTQINKKNVGRLRLAWSFSDGQMYGHEGAPRTLSQKRRAGKTGPPFLKSVRIRSCRAGPWCFPSARRRAAWC